MGINNPVAAEIVQRTVRKTADEIVNNSNVLQNDNELLFPVGVNECWEFVLQLIWDTSAVADIKYAFVVPAGGIIRGMYAWVVGGSGGEPVDLALTPFTQNGSGVGTAYVSRCYGWYIGGANAGNVQLQWAQNTAEASNTKVLTNSLIVAHKLT